MSTVKAKPLKKATKKNQRYQRAQRNYRLVTIAALVEASMGKVQENIDNGVLHLESKASAQKEKVLKWTDRLLTDPNTRIGVNSQRSAYQLVWACERVIDNYMGIKGTVAGLGMIWIALSYLCDESRFIANQGESSQKYNMNTLASTVSTWTDMLLEFVDENQEGTAAELAEKLREITIKEA